MLSSSFEMPIGDALYIAAFEMIMLKHMLDISALFSAPYALDRTLIALFFVFVITKIILQKYSLKSLCLLGILSIIVLSSNMNGKFYTFIYGYFLVIAVQGIDFSRFIKVSCYSKTVIILLHVIAYIVSTVLFGVSGTVLRDDRIRHAFFIGHPNAFTFVFTWTLFEYIFVYYENMRFIHFIPFLTLVGLSYHFTDSNSGVMVFSVVFLLVLCDKYLKKAFEVISAVTVRFGHTVLSILFLVFACIYPMLTGAARELWLTIDTFFNGRTHFGAYAISQFGITFFGRKLRLPEKVYWLGFWLDNSGAVPFDNYYLGHYMAFGFLNLLLISFAFFIFCKRMENKEKIIIIAFILYGAMEAYAATVAYCFALLIIGKCIFNPKSKTMESSNITDEETIPLWKRKLV